MGSIIIGAGQWRGRKLMVGGRARPTSVRLRQTLFNWLGQTIPSWVVLDLFSGSGALGLESLSRGAAHVTFVESDRSVLSALKTNIMKFSISPSSWTLLPILVEKSISRLPLASFNLILADPPFHEGYEYLLDQLYAYVANHGFLYWEAEKPILIHHLWGKAYRHTRVGQSYATLFVKTPNQ